MYMITYNVVRENYAATANLHQLTWMKISRNPYTWNPIRPYTWNMKCTLDNFAVVAVTSLFNVISCLQDVDAQDWAETDIPNNDTVRARLRLKPWWQKVTSSKAVGLYYFLPSAFPVTVQLSSVTHSLRRQQMGLMDWTINNGTPVLSSWWDERFSMVLWNKSRFCGSQRLSAVENVTGYSRTCCAMVARPVATRHEEAVASSSSSFKLFETQINVLRNCKKKKKYGRKSRTNLLLLLCAYVPPLCCNL